MSASAAAIRSINALTLATKDMASSCSFYTKLGLFLTHGGYVVTPHPHHFTKTFSHREINCADVWMQYTCAHCAIVLMFK